VAPGLDFQTKEKERKMTGDKRWRLFIATILSLLVLASFLWLHRASELKTSHSLYSKGSYTIAKDLTELTHLVVVPGHAIHRCHTKRDLTQANGACWTLLPYQHNQVASFLDHLRKAIQLVAGDPKALLMLSGGQTRAAAGPYSESSAYLMAAELLDWFGHPTVAERCVTEDFARDSLQNVLFALCRFWQITGMWPAKVTMIGFPFKAQRFLDSHWPTCQSSQMVKTTFEYVAIGDNGGVDDAWPLFQADPEGCLPALRQKRKIRNPYRQQHSYGRCPHRLVQQSCHMDDL
jgi:hypothetical protein